MCRKKWALGTALIPPKNNSASDIIKKDMEQLAEQQTLFVQKLHKANANSVVKNYLIGDFCVKCKDRKIEKLYKCFPNIYV